MVQLVHFPQELPEDLRVWTHFQSLSNCCQTRVSGREMDCILPSLQWSGEGWERGEGEADGEGKGEGREKEEEERRGEERREGEVEREKGVV